ncbi:MAG: GDSL-type esterase/lipase family protein [Planctomycetota bacterium]
MTGEADIRIVVLGDSITKGDQVGEAKRFTTLVQKELSERLGQKIEVINAGVNADVTELARHRLQRDVFAHKPNYAVIMFGVNDAGFYRPETPERPGHTTRVAAEGYRRYLNEMADKIEAAGIKVIFATPVPMSRHYWLAHLPQYQKHGLNYIVDEYAKIMRDVAEERGAPMIDVHREFSIRPQTGDFIPDGIHPDRRGHRIIADVYIQSLMNILAE